MILSIWFSYSNCDLFRSVVKSVAFSSCDFDVMEFLRNDRWDQYANLILKVVGDGFSIQNYHRVADSGILESVISMFKVTEELNASCSLHKILHTVSYL